MSLRVIVVTHTVGAFETESLRVMLTAMVESDVKHAEVDKRVGDELWGHCSAHSLAIWPFWWHWKQWPSFQY